MQHFIISHLLHGLLQTLEHFLFTVQSSVSELVPVMWSSRTGRGQEAKFLWPWPRRSRRSPRPWELHWQCLVSASNL